MPTIAGPDVAVVSDEDLESMDTNTFVKAIFV